MRRFILFALMAGTVISGPREDLLARLPQIYGAEPVATAQGAVGEGAFPEYWTVQSPDGLLGYALLAQGRGKINPFEYMVAFDSLGVILDVWVLRYREHRGKEIMRARWLAQFKGRDSNSKFRAGRDIDAISGATISATSIAKGVAALATMVRDPAFTDRLEKYHK